MLLSLDIDQIARGDDFVDEINSHVETSNAERTWKLYEPGIDYRKPC